MALRGRKRIWVSKFRLMRGRHGHSNGTPPQASTACAFGPPTVKGTRSPRSGVPWQLEAVGTAEWTGTPLRGLLEEAGLRDDAVEILFTGLDRGVQGDEVQYYQRSLTIDEASGEDVLLAYQMNGEPLSPPHGYPLRLIVPCWYGMTNVKWLGRVEAIGEPFHG